MIDNNGITFRIPKKPPKFCPHCGAEAEFKAASTYNSPGAVIRCSKCNAQSNLVSAGHYMYYKGQPDVTLTMEQATEEVRAVWDARVAGPPDQLERYLLSNFRKLSEEQQHEYLNHLQILSETHSRKFHIVSNSSDDEGGGDSDD